MRVDTDGDGYSDGVELIYGGDPDNCDDHPVMGDLNNDGLTTLEDVLILRRSLDSLPYQDSMWDANWDSVIDEEDADIFFFWLMGKPGYEMLPHGEW